KERTSLPLLWFGKNARFNRSISETQLELLETKRLQSGIVRHLGRPTRSARILVGCGNSGNLSPVAGPIGILLETDFVSSRHGAVVLAESPQRESAVALDFGESFGIGSIFGVERDASTGKWAAVAADDLTLDLVGFRWTTFRNAAAAGGRHDNNQNCPDD